MIGTHATLEIVDGLAWITLVAPQRSLPVLDLALIADLEAAVSELEHRNDWQGLIVRGREELVFAAGADIGAIAGLTDEFQALALIERGQRLYDRIEDLRGRIRGRMVAAIGGACAGGAYELALALGTILAVEDPRTKIGLPEVMLGILPAWGGSTRLPRRIGVPAALEVILQGRLMGAREAHKKGLVDRLCAKEDLWRIAGELARGSLPLVRRSRGLAGLLVDRNPGAIGALAWFARRQVRARTGWHYPAPLEIARVVPQAVLSSRKSSLHLEAELAARLVVSPVTKHLIRIFRLSEEAKGLAKFADGTRAQSPRMIGVLGAGVMGRRIAQVSAERGFATRLFDIAPAALDTALFEHRAAVESKLMKRRIQRHEALAQLDALDTTQELATLTRQELVVEAVAEKLDVKRKVFRELAARLPADAILATNTSSLSVSAIAEGLPNPERVVGLHFFNPVAKMPLVEIVRGRATSESTLRRTAAFALALGKTPIITADCAGFLVNRLLGPYLDECVRMLEAGVDPARLERALKNFGMPMGPLELLDEVGLDIAAHAAQSLHSAYGARMQPCGTLERMLAEKRLGKKSGLGFYQHGPRRKLAKDLARFVTQADPALARLSQAAIAQRALLAMLNEAARALEERVVESARELDLATIFGMGFPPFRGGLLAWADEIGPSEVAVRMNALHAGTNPRFEPAGRILAGCKFHAE
jgi:3-hydroxyacyl-CoA dehydrogenase/enoyl-CoA hydratase/3-hydroxybutyryl-CoA epimerase